MFTTWFNTVSANIMNMVVWPLFLAVVVIMFIWAGALFLLAHGDPEKLTGARNTLLYAIVGIVVFILSFSVMQIIARVTSNQPQSLGSTDSGAGGGGGSGAGGDTNTDNGQASSTIIEAETAT